MATTSSVLITGEPRFDMVGKKLPSSLHDTDEVMSDGLVRRLRRYAEKSLVDAGFSVSSWACEVYTMDGDRRPPDRIYCVEFTNSKGGMLGVQGIMTNAGWPCLDHGVCVDVGRQPQEPRP